MHRKIRLRSLRRLITTKLSTSISKKLIQVPIPCYLSSGNSVIPPGPDEQDYNATGYDGTLATLKPINKEQSIGFSYSYSSIRGKLNPRYKPEFVYILPCKKDRQVKVMESSFLGATYFGNSTPEDWKAYRFITRSEDTVTAIRKGLVVSVTDLYENNTPLKVYIVLLLPIFILQKTLIWY